MSLALAMSAALPADAAPGDLPVLYVNATGPLTPLDHDLLAVPKIPVGSALHNAPARVALGDTIVLWLVTHDDGGQELYRQVITTRDVDPPEFVDGQDTYVTGRTGKLTDANFEVPTAVDAVDLDVDVSRSHEPGSGFRTGNTTVKFTATDDSGNSAVHEMVVVVTDPRIRNLVLEATHDRIRATWDPLPGNPQYKASISERGGDALETAKTRDTVHVFHNLDESTEYVVTVGEVGERSTTARKTVETAEEPVREVIFPDDVVREATAPLTPVQLGGVIVRNWDPAPSISNDAPAAFPVGNTTVVWTVTDGDGIRTGKQVVAITDTTKPVFSNLPESSTHRATSERGAEVRFVIPAATDAADPDVAVKPSHISGAHFPVGNTTVAFTATDGSGNTARHEIVITVVQYPGLGSLDTFDSLDGWTPRVEQTSAVVAKRTAAYQAAPFGHSNNYNIEIDPDFGNPAPSLKISGSGALVTTGVSKTFDISDLGDRHLIIEVEVWSNSYHYVKAGDGYSIGHSAKIWFDSEHILSSRLGGVLNWSVFSTYITPFLRGEDLLTINLGIQDRVTPETYYATYFDNFRLKAIPVSRGHSAGDIVELPPTNQDSAHSGSPGGSFRAETSAAHDTYMTISESDWLHETGSAYEAPAGTCYDGTGRSWQADVDLSDLDTGTAGQYPITYVCAAYENISIEVRIVNVVDAASP
ncbi:MAG: HYR domain-containing protein [Nitrosopumilus sp.]|nr:HYR domain-containing protein [Nitrosopumilus sp.]